MDAIALIKKHEGFRSKVYLDSVGKLTVGYGICIEDTGISEDEAEYILRNRVGILINSLHSTYPWFADLDEVRTAVMIDLAYNLGMQGLSKFRNFLGNMALKNYESAAGELENSIWHKQVKNRALELEAMVRTGKWTNG